MYELRKGSMMLLIPNKKDVEHYIKNGWFLVKKEQKNTHQEEKTQNNKEDKIVRK